jgi:ATP-dependent 26S proteasome regulatory subunit
MVIEDADMFLKARSEGNTTMHKFLNVGDGLVTTRNKKLIFSTNLPSIRDIDPALIRPGRCFDIVTFDLLDQQAAEKLAKKMNVTLTETKDKWNIADIFNKQTFDPHITTKRTTMGFV